ncbi:MAG: hypothetical protein IT229_12490, partial [Flavobacteriales bacterium]|nr:hypothetical protein [Flavobacteriales bacterium]
MRSLLFLFLALFMTELHAQGPDVEAWMARHFSGKEGVKQDLAADEELYAAMGLDSLRKNRFIGEVKGTTRMPDGSAPVKFVMWTDTLEAVLHFHSPGDTTTFVADLRNNTITIIRTGTEEGEVNSSINDLRERVVVNWYRYKDDGSPWRVHRRKPYDRNGGILGQDMARWTEVKGDTIQFVRYPHGLSPFVDALEWMPYGGDYPFNLFMQLARAGDPMPKTLTSRAGTVNVDIMRMGPGPRPLYRMGKDVLDTRTKAHHVLPIRRTNRRTMMADLDPIFTIPEGQEHGWATADPGDPDEPEVSFTGTRSCMRLFEKEPCGAVGTVVVKVWIDRKGIVQRAEVDKARSTIRSQACLDQALEAAKRDTFYPIEGGMPMDTGELTFEYKAVSGGNGRGQVDGGGSGMGNGVGNGTGVGPGSGLSSRAPF